MHHNTKIVELGEIFQEKYSLIFKNIIFAFLNCEVRQYNLFNICVCQYKPLAPSTKSVMQHKKR